MAFYTLEPWGDARAAEIAGYTAWRLAQAWGCKAPMRAFTPAIQEPRPRQTAAQQQAIWAGMAAAVTARRTPRR